MTEILCPIEAKDPDDISSLLTLAQSLSDQLAALQSRIDSLLSVSDTETTEPVRLARSQYITADTHGMDANNSDIVGVNALVFRDESEMPEEGLMFPDTSGNYDILKSLNGELLYCVGHTLGNENPVYKVLNDDTGWHNVTLKDGYNAATTNRHPRYRRKNGIVYIEGALKNTAEIPGGTTESILFTLPAGFRPAQIQVLRAQSGGPIGWTLIVQTNGNVTFSRYGNEEYINLPANSLLCTCCSFIAAD